MGGFELFLALMAEGFRAAILPCTLVLLVTGLAIGFVAKEFAIPALCSFWLAALAVGWARLAGHTGEINRFILATGLVGAAAITLRPPIRRGDWVALVSGAVTGAVASQLWLPCVGEAFGQLIMQLPGRGVSGVILLGVYLVGALSPVLCFATIHHLTPDPLLDRVEPVWALVGAVMLVVIAAAVALNLHETVIGYLFIWSAG